MNDSIEPSIIIHTVNSDSKLDIKKNHIVTQYDNQIKDSWKSCCFTVNVRALKYIIQVSILTMLIIYSSVMLVVNPECESQRNYSSLLMICLGCFMPQPKISQ
jgi:hypothetical protein